MLTRELDVYWFLMDRILLVSFGSDFLVFSKVQVRFSKVWIQVRLKIGLSFRRSETVRVKPFRRYDNTKMVSKCL